MKPSDLFGKFDIGGGTMYAYGPASDEEFRDWRIVYEKDNEIIHEEYVHMMCPPVFECDADDIAVLNSRVEEIIKELDLE